VSETGFEGFSKKTLDFFDRLTRSNTKKWFGAHRDDYEEHVLTPSRTFVLALGDKLIKAAPGVQADPRINKSLFRINRDTRFSKDKTPYKTHLGLWFWEGPGKRMECSGFYFQLDPTGIMLGTGLYCFTRELLDHYRRSVVDPKHGPALVRAVNKVQKAGFDIGGRFYKKTPRGYDPKHKNADFLLFNGLYAGFQASPPEELYSEKLVDYCMDVYKKTLPLHKWLLAMTERAV
jgi:uncharacterized protein (TIGR02453 family)